MSIDVKITPPDTTLKATVQEHEAFDIIGLSIITSNEKDRAVDDINALWQRFFEENIGDRILNKTGQTIYAVYSDYEGDHTKPYRLTIGFRVEDTDKIPHGMSAASVPASIYAVFGAAGEQPKALVKTWEGIWSSSLKRTYKADFEVYGVRFFEPGLNEVLVYVGVETEDEKQP